MRKIPKKYQEILNLLSSTPIDAKTLRNTLNETRWRIFKYSNWYFNYLMFRMECAFLVTRKNIYICNGKQLIIGRIEYERK